ncbi:MAG TPA: pyridine nucleotide-disulfide oxidoreductase [Clostridiales bacterium]|jgi:predicted molibdopterin-dependent oxidoreductase YjgC|nr:pyridine nucleotide-disulfide oxidoreductase [Clostridiales bacterium]
MRIENHPILDFGNRKSIKFYFEGKEMEGLEGDTIASALHAAGVKVLGESLFKHRPRGFYCAIGNCSSCLMTVNGKSNVKTCVTILEEGTRVEIQKDKGGLE